MSEVDAGEQPVRTEADQHDMTDWGLRLTEETRLRGRLCMHVARRMLGNSAEAEDVVQSAFMRAWECRGDIRDHQALPGWLLRVVVNLCLERLRRRKVEFAGLALQPTPEAPNSPSRDIALRESVILALDALPEMTRLVVVLRLMEGRSGAETGELINRSMSEVSRHLHEGMRRLRTLLADWRQDVAAMRIGNYEK